MNPDLEVERRNIPFNSYELSCVLYGGKEAYERRIQIAKVVDNVYEFENPKPLEYMTREERYANNLRKTIAVMETGPKLNITKEEENRYFLYLAYNGDMPPINVHHGMFIPTLKNQCTDEQKAKWLPMATSYGIIGTYAQTELGHGTNLRKLETEAIYDSEAQEFVVNSPTLTATKWWPGNLGKTANHAVVMAQLHTKGTNRGIHAFIVPLRDLKTHQPLPGITIGDIGPKFGTDSFDNGYLRLDHVRIPRENMLMKFAKVHPDGTYVAPKHDKLVYGTMVQIRSIMIVLHSLGLGKAVTIATRYSCVRRQGEIFEGKGEVKLLDYQTQQYRLFPELAKVYALLFAGRHIHNMCTEITAKVQQGDVNQLHELHIISSGLKALGTFDILKGIEICRLSCGGHGYSHASGLPEMYAAVGGGPTYEGDNIVMLLQVARHLVKIVTSRTQDPFSSYLWKSFPTKSPLTENLEMDHLLDAYEHAAQRAVLSAVNLLVELTKQGYSREQAWHKCAVPLSKSSKAHVRVFVVKNFIDQVQKMEDSSVKKVMSMMCKFYALYGIHSKSGAFTEDGYMSQNQLNSIRRKIEDLLAEIRPIAVPLVDAFGLKDKELNSELGRYDGNVYPNLFKWARESPLNKQDVLDCHHKYIRPMLQRSKM